MSEEKYDEEKGKEYTVMGRTKEFGKTSVEIECPHCLEHFTAYVWSMCGGGKKCPKCGAMHSRWGNAYPMKPKEKLKPLTFEWSYSRNWRRHTYAWLDRGKDLVYEYQIRATNQENNTEYRKDGYDLYLVTQRDDKKQFIKHSKKVIELKRYAEELKNDLFSWAI